MPYEKIEDLPSRIKNNLPKKAQIIFLKTFNRAWNEYVEPNRSNEFNPQEIVAFKVAWSAVKKVYRKNVSGVWVKIVI